MYIIINVPGSLSRPAKGWDAGEKPSVLRAGLPNRLNMAWSSDIEGAILQKRMYNHV